MTFSSLMHLFTPHGLMRCSGGGGLPDGLNVRFVVGHTPGAIDVAARLGLETAALNPGFTAPGAPGVPLIFGPGNPDCPPVAVPEGCGVIALTEAGVVVTGDTPEAGWDAARWLAATFPVGVDDRRPVTAIYIKDGAVVDVRYGEGEVAPTPDKPLIEGAPPAPPFTAPVPGDLPPAGPARLFTTAGLMGSSDGVRHDRAGWQVWAAPHLTPAEIAGLCELAARTGVEATGLRFPFAVAEPVPSGERQVILSAHLPAEAEWRFENAVWSGSKLVVAGAPDQRAATLCRIGAEVGLVDGLHANLFTRRAALPVAPLPEGDVIFDIALDQEWEVDRFRRVWGAVTVQPGLPVTVDLRLSEPAAVREALAEAIAADLADRGVPEARIRVLSAYKQGFHWLEEEILPRLQALGAGAVSRVEVRCAPFAGATAGAPGDILGHHTQPNAAPEGGVLEMPIRWLQELYPADELLALALPGATVAFDLADAPQTEIYQLRALDPQGNVLLQDGLSPTCSARVYLPEFPERGRVHPPTGLLRVEQAGRILTETALDTDAEAFWTAYQEQVLPRLRQFLTPAPDPGTQPFFGKLVVEVGLSEDDRRLPIRQEQISPLDALHEDLYFYTLDYLNQLGISTVGKGYNAPGGVEPWVVKAEGGPRARVRLFASPQATAACADALPAKAADLPAPANGLTMTEIIGPDQLPAYLAYLAQLPQVRVWRTGLSFAGRPTWALSVLPPTEGAIAPPQKLSAWRPTFLVNARHHANEVSSTNSILQLAELAASQSAAQGVNLVLSPMENADGAAIHYAMQQVHPQWKLHAARFNAAGVEFAWDCYEAEPRFGESRTLPTLWRAFLPDVVLDDHGYPSHEWVQPFSGYSSAPYFRTSWWMPNALIYGIYKWLDAEQFPGNHAAQAALRDAMADRLAADAEIESYTKVMLDRYVTYGRRYVPEKFPLELHKGFISMSGNVAAGPEAKSYSARFPHITAAEITTEVPDETAQGDYLALCARAHLEGDLAVLSVLQAKAQPVVRRRWTEGGHVYWAVGRERPFRP